MRVPHQVLLIGLELSRCGGNPHQSPDCGLVTASPKGSLFPCHPERRVDSQLLPRYDHGILRGYAPQDDTVTGTGTEKDAEEPLRLFSVFHFSGSIPQGPQH